MQATPTATEPAEDDLWRWATLAMELCGMAIMVYYLVESCPERYKIEIRRWVRSIFVPFDAAAARKKARGEMISDVLTLITYGIPADWAST